MRMRKKPWAKELIQQHTECVCSQPEAFRGNWRQLSPADEVRVEIGSGKGDYWIRMSHMYPNILWVAMERSVDCVGIALKKAAEDILPNMKIICADAAGIRDWFAEGEVDVIHLNFSDPWPKKSHTKRRLTSGSFLNDYRHILKPDGSIIMKTDNASMFEYSLLSFQNDGWILKEVSVDYRRDEHPEDAITEYENNFMSLGQPIYRAVWRKPEEE